MELVAKAAPYLAQHGSTSPRLDAELLLADTLDLTRMDLYLQFERPLSADEVDRYREACRRRAGGEPVAYIRGRREFMSLDLLVTPAVMIPRPETEVLVEAALRVLAEIAPEGRATGGPRVLDVGTGSGAIALAVAAGRTDSRVLATDISADALEIAGRNVQRLEMQDRVELRQADLVDGVRDEFDLVLANLPYIDPDWPDAVTAEVAASEPAVALYAGRAGLDLFRRLLPELPRLAPGGQALLEFDPRQSAGLRQIAEPIGMIEVLTDLAGRERVLVISL
ncbi:MAG TPA: peptide chain release factor N(5)-glutamine methyltransferase [Candidatus Solibacter sp.]|jgi:release factor glutamine methyltransferase|nr:peptide chain release factor N(5)-glutamine methyltransferase [Candidatus Solibacter sp.]